MLLRKLGSSEFFISSIGLGTWAMAGPNWGLAWGPQDDAHSLATLEYALDRGVNWIDTAAVYGLGHAETVVGVLLKGLSHERRPMVFTKGGLVWDEQGRISHCLDPDSLAAEVDASLQRLGVDMIDLYQIHWPSLPPGGPDDGIEAALDRLARLRSAGKIRELGVSNFDVGQLKRSLAVAPIVSLQPPYSALMRDVEDEILPFCGEAGIGVIPYSTLQSGLLTGAFTRERRASLPDDDWRKARSADFREPRLSQVLKLVACFEQIAMSHTTSTAAVAIA
jgi:aryl-alcohol dehydrogenase-like predicted oxidoreductase